MCTKVDRSASGFVAAILSGALFLGGCGGGGGGGGGGSAGMAGVGSLAATTSNSSTGTHESKPAAADALESSPPLGTVELIELGKVIGSTGAGGTAPGTGSAKPSETPPGYQPPVGELDATPSGAGILVIVGSGIEVPAGATQVDQIKDVRWNTLTPGSVVRVAPGTYVGTIAITATARRRRPSASRPRTARRCPSSPPAWTSAARATYASAASTCAPRPTAAS